MNWKKKKNKQRQKISDYKAREWSDKCTKEELQRQIKQEVYKATIFDILADHISDAEIWIASIVYRKGQM